MPGALAHTVVSQGGWRWSEGAPRFLSLRALYPGSAVRRTIWRFRTSERRVVVQHGST